MRVFQQFPKRHLCFWIVFSSLLFLPNKAYPQTNLDYALEENWASLPSIPDPSDYTPPGIYMDSQSHADVDVFFVHPTSYFAGNGWNAPLDKKSVNKRTDSGTIKNQASVFNGSARVFAPRYRQAKFKSYWNLEKGGKEALDFAYADVKQAFQYYLDHHNQGRPMIIASHSQGTTHATRLLQEFFDNKKLQSRLVVAYIPGLPVSKKAFESIAICSRPEQTGCVCAWATYQGSKKPHKILRDNYLNAICVNPITWKTDTAWSQREKHKGILMPSFKLKYAASLSARVHERGYLQITKPDVAFKWLYWKRNWHIADYNMFWPNIRHNVAYRIKLYWKT